VPDNLVHRLRAGATIALAAFVVISVLAAPPPPEDRAEAIGSLIRCPVCAGEPIADSPAGLAEDMMSLVREGVSAGLTDQEIIDSVVGAYGADAQVLDPPFNMETVWLWLVPALALVGGIAAALSRRRNREALGS